jgi:fucose 4-O-acetylase-like acetyltransferase
MTQPSSSFDDKGDRRLIYLDNMRAGAIIMVVITHSMGYCGELTSYQRAVSDFFFHSIAVPVFFFADGYLSIYLYNNNKQFVYSTFIQKSFFRLIVPWIIFTVFYTIIRFNFENFGFLNEKLIINHSVSDILLAMYGSVYAPQMYFLLSLFFIRLSVPLILKGIQSFKKIFITFFLFYIVAFYQFNAQLSSFLNIAGGQEPILHAIWGIQFFMLGALIMLYKRNLASLFKWFPPLSLIIIILLLQTAIASNYSGLISQYLYLLSYFSVFFLLKQSRVNFSQVGKNTMGIYLLHAPIILKGVSLILTQFIHNGLIALALISLLCFIISYQATLIINRTPLGKFLFGSS